MKNIFILLVVFLGYTHANGQVAFSAVDYTVTTEASSMGSALYCKGPAFLYRFEVSQKVEIIQQNLAMIDSQVVLITPLRIDNLKKAPGNLPVSEIKELLSTYLKYELQYFKEELNIEVINPNSQWVVAGSRTWLVWYFKVGTIPLATASKTDVQLFASTIIDGNILTVNAPVFENKDFNKAALIVNSLMESLSKKENGQ